MNTITLKQAVKLYIVYLRAKRISPMLLAAYVRSLRHILVFYGFDFPVFLLNGKRILQYADIYDPWQRSPLARERAIVFWRFVHWLKRNGLIPAFSEE